MDREYTLLEAAMSSKPVSETKYVTFCKSLNHLSLAFSISSIPHRVIVLFKLNNVYNMRRAVPGRVRAQ